jgi:SWI/SNF-related matrix-associated actin-dependent regulator 1 of chromatin subfamily A
MILDYVAATKYFTLRVPRSNAKQISDLMQTHGLDFSQARSTSSTAVLMTKEPYAAVAFSKYATPYATAELHGIATAIEESWSPDNALHVKCPMDKELWPFQRASVAYALRRRNTLVGDQPGLGKTPIAVCIANEIAAKRVLVLCPANIRLQWVDRIREWSTMRWPYIVYPIIHGRTGVHPNAHWTVVSYDLARTEAIGAALARGTYDLLILDEIHYLKNIETGRTRAVFGDAAGMVRQHDKETKEWRTLFRSLSSASGMVLGLSGTPLPNRPREAYTIARGLCFDSIDWMSEDHFKKRFNPSMKIEGEHADGTPYTYVREEVGRAPELQARLRANFMVRHLKRDVMPQLKLPVYDIVRVDETRAVRSVLEAESMLDIDQDLLEMDIKVDGQWAIIRHQMGLAIAPQVADYAAMCIDGGDEKLVIFAWHIDVLNYLEEKLARFGVLRIDGSTTAKQKQVRVKIFQEDRRFKIMLGNTLSLGTGTDGLQHVACHALLAEPDPVPGNNEQAVDRLDRGGQLRTVQADLFVAPGSILERILAGSLHKRHNTHKALDAR